MKITAPHINLFNTVDFKVARATDDDVVADKQPTVKESNPAHEEKKVINLEPRNGIWVDDGNNKRGPSLGDDRASQGFSGYLSYNSMGKGENSPGEKGRYVNFKI